VNKFRPYLDPRISLNQRLNITLTELAIATKIQKSLDAFLDLLIVKDMFTYEHSVRVALLDRLIAQFIGLNERALFFAGALHDIGKIQTRLELLQKTAGWTQADREEMKQHVMIGHELLCECFSFSAEIIIWHHRFQTQCYPETLPPLLHQYSDITEDTIPRCGRVLALADSYDAAHRINENFGNDQPLTGALIKEKMIASNADQSELVKMLYDANIFTEELF